MTTRDEWPAVVGTAEAAAGPVAGPALRRAVDALAAQLAVCAAAVDELSAGAPTGPVSAARGGAAAPAPAPAPVVAARRGAVRRGQLTAIALRLGRLRPVRLGSWARVVLAEARHRPAGDPAVLRAAALATRHAADGVRAGPMTGADGPLDGLVATSAAAAARATGTALDRVPVALRAVADGLDRLATAIEEQQRRHAGLRAVLAAALHDATHVGSAPAPDPMGLARLARAVPGIVRGARAAHTDAALAADAAAMTFADAASTARAAAAAAGGLAPLDAIVLAAQTVRAGGAHDAGVLTIAQLVRAAERLTPATRETVRAAASAVERAYVLKLVAAGATDAEVAAFAAEIRGRDDRWLHHHLSLLDRGGPGPQDRFGAEVDQFDAFTCGTTSLVVARAEHDPRHALALTRGLEPPYDAADREEFDRRLSAVQQRVHDETNSLWPQQFGTLVGGVTRWLDGRCGAGWTWRLVDDTAPRVVSAAVRDVTLAVDAGHVVPLLVGGAVPRHYVLAVGHAAGELLIFEPTSGDVRRVPVDDVIGGRLRGAAGFDHLQAVVLPRCA